MYRQLQLATLFGLLAAALAPGQDRERSSSPPCGELEEVLGVPAYVLRTYKFAGDSGKVRVEVRYGLVNDVLQFAKRDEGRYLAALETSLAVVDRHQNLVASRIWKRQFEVSRFEDTNDRRRLNEDGVVFQLVPAEYELTVELTDLDTHKRLRRSYPLDLRDFDHDSLRLSSLVIGAPVVPGGGSDSLQPNLLALLRAPEASAGVGFEIYGLRQADTVTVDFALTNWRREVLARWHTALVATGPRLRHFEPLAAHLTFQGPQSLQVTVRGRGQVAAAETDLRVHCTAAAASEVAQLLESAPELAYLPLRYISKGGEFKRIAASAGAEREALVEAFWRQRDPSPASETHELREEFYRRVAFAQAHFSVPGAGKPGWASDRGRIYIIYGPPREVHHQITDSDTTPYEIWLYPQRDLRFVFRDKHGSGDFELVRR